MTKRRISNRDLENIYNLAIQCRDVKSTSILIEDFAVRLNLSPKTLKKYLYNWCSANKIKTISQYINDKVVDELAKQIKLHPENIHKCFRNYVSKTYPELNKKDNEEDFNRTCRRVAAIWYSRGTKKHVCFMTVSAKGKAIINGKNKLKANEEYSKGFFYELKSKIVSLFKSVF